MTELEVERLVGVYQIRNYVTGKVYVGSASKCILARWKTHKRKLRTGTHHCRHLQASWNKYGATKFVLKILERCPPDQCVHREQYWIDHLRAHDRRYGYNSRPTAESNRGMVFGPMSPGHREAIGRSLRGRTLTRETKAKISASNTGKKHNDESRLKMSKAVRPRGYKRSVEVGKKVSATRKRMVAEGRLVTGHPQTEQTRLKLSEAARGRVISEETRAKISAAKRGKPWSAARRAAAETSHVGT